MSHRRKEEIHDERKIDEVWDDRDGRRDFVAGRPIGRRNVEGRNIFVWNRMLVGRKALPQYTAVCADSYKCHYSLSCFFVGQYVQIES
jgi:hypothetical protein